MATRKRITHESWLHDAMVEIKDGRKCSMISVVHQKASGATQEVDTIKFAGSTKAWTAAEVHSRLKAKAEGFSQDLSGAQMFQYLAFYGQSEPESVLPFTIRPEHDPNVITPSEPATPEGKLSQNMRQGEAVFGQMYSQQRHLNEVSNTLINNLSAMLTNMTARYDAMFHGMKELLMEQALNTHKHEMERLQYQRQTEERKKWIGYVPMLANTVSGREIFPQSNADTVLVEQVAASLDENTVMMLAQVLKPELIGPLMMRVEQFQAKKRQEAEAAGLALVPVPGINPEDDAAGGSKEK